MEDPSRPCESHMSRRSSAISASTSAPAIANGHVSLLPPPEKQTARASRAVSTSVSNAPVNDTPTITSTNVNPDELFTKHTISELKAIQQRLRYPSLNLTFPARLLNQRLFLFVIYSADADAKQEELRLMVGCVVPLWTPIRFLKIRFFESVENGTVTSCKLRRRSSQLQRPPSV